MNYFKNEERKIFRELTDEQKLVIIANKGTGNVESPVTLKGSNEWVKSNTYSIELECTYRVAPNPISKAEMRVILKAFYISDDSAFSMDCTIREIFERGLVQ